MRFERITIVAAIAVAAAPARADETAATAAYDRAKALSDAGNWVEACPLFDKSYKADPQIGALLNLADCHEHVGKTATAWSEFRHAGELATQRGDDRRASYAKKRADDLAPKLAKLAIAKPATPPAGLVVRRDGEDVTAFLGDELPVDPGEHAIAIEAPGYAAATVTAKAAAGTVARVELPALVKVPAASAAAQPRSRAVRVELELGANTTAPIGVSNNAVAREEFANPPGVLGLRAGIAFEITRHLGVRLSGHFVAGRDNSSGAVDGALELEGRVAPSAAIELFGGLGPSYGVADAKTATPVFHADGFGLQVHAGVGVRKGDVRFAFVATNTAGGDHVSFGWLTLCLALAYRFHI